MSRLNWKLLTKKRGSSTKGIPAGKYRIALEHVRKKKDVFNGLYDGDKSPFVFDVDSSTGELVINLDDKKT